MTMELSVILPLFNSRSTMGQALSFFERPLNRNCELIVVDDASADGSLEELDRWVKRIPNVRIQVLRNERNQGPSYSRNRGLDLATGEFIAFLDADDAWHEQKLDIQIGWMKRLNSPISGTVHQIISRDALPEWRGGNVSVERADIQELTWKSMLFKTPFATPSVVLHRSVAHFRFDETLRYCEDLNMWHRLSHDHRTFRINVPLTFTFKHNFLTKGQSLSSDSKRMQQGLLAGYVSLLRSQDYPLGEKALILLAIFFAQAKFIRRALVKHDWLTMNRNRERPS